MSYFIGPGCSTCHYCYNTCPAGAIRFVGLEYAIDPDKCVGCGACAEVCPSGIIKNEGLEKAPVGTQTKRLAADAVVLGGGGAGLVAAVRYRQLTGKRVIVLEKATKPGGNTNLGHAFVVRYSKLHQKAGMPDLRDQAIGSIWNGSDGPEMDRELLRKAVYGLSDMFDWLCGFGGVEEHFHLVDLREHPIPNGPFVYTPGFFDFPERTQNTRSTDHSMGPGWMGTFVVEKMLEQCKKLDIPVLTQHRATAIQMDKGGCFQSVEAQGPEGTTVVEAGCCLIATGGFARNREIVERIRPTFYEGLPVHTFSVASNTGDAIGMVEAIGGKLDLQHVKVPMMGPVHHPFHYGVVSLVNSPRIVLVNMDGRRFQNEAAPPAPGKPTGPLENQPQHKAYAIFDSLTAEKMGAELLERSQGDPGLYRGMVSWREQLEEECGYDLAAKKADTIDDLARLIGIDPDSLSREIKTYNQSCAQGADEDFNKPNRFLDPVRQAPFYAVLMLRFNEGAEGGIANDSSLRVLRKDGTPFHGLYVAGDCCRGVLKQDDEGGKMGEMPWAMASGYLAGAEMAAFQKASPGGYLQ